MSSPLHSLAEELVQLHTGLDRGQVAIAGAGVAVTRGKAPANTRIDLTALRAAMAQVIGRELGLDIDVIVEVIVDRLVVLEEADGVATIRVCGSELCGLEDLQTATDRARSMRAVLVAELQRALSDEPPATIRRSVRPSSAEAR
jgi:hypothetical protein